MRYYNDNPPPVEHKKPILSGKGGYLGIGLLVLYLLSGRQHIPSDIEVKISRQQTIEQIKTDFENGKQFRLLTERGQLAVSKDIAHIEELPELGPYGEKQYEVIITLKGVERRVSLLAFLYQ